MEELRKYLEQMMKEYKENAKEYVKGMFPELDDVAASKMLEQAYRKVRI